MGEIKDINACIWGKTIKLVEKHLTTLIIIEHGEAMRFLLQSRLALFKMVNQWLTAIFLLIVALIMLNSLMYYTSSNF